MIFSLLNAENNNIPDKPAIISAGGCMTYPELIDKINRSAAWLNLLGVKAGSHAAVVSGNNIDFIILLFALWRTGAVPVPMNIRLTDEDIEKLITHSKSNFTFVHADCADRITGNKTIFPVKETFSRQSFPAKTEAGTDADADALILYTSGTTGHPKGVILSYNNLLHSALASDTIIHHGENERWLASLPFYHIGGLSVPVRAFLFGAAVILPDSLKAKDIKSALGHYKPTLASFVSTTLKRLLELKALPPKELKLVFLGGGPINSTLAKEALDKGWIIAKVYGSTETASMVTCIILNDNPGKADTAGLPLASNRVVILDESGNFPGTGVSGEIAVAGKSVMKGYLKNPDEAGKEPQDNFYLTGDTGYLDEEGYLHLESRRTDLIVSGGENINPPEVESALLQPGSVTEACVFPMRDDEWGQIVAAAVVAASPEVNEENIRQSLRLLLPSYKIPRHIFFLEDMPKTALGKIMRGKIREMFDN